MSQLSILEKLRDQINKNPYATCVSQHNESYSYQDLERHSNQLANYLKSFDTNLGDFIVIYMRRSFYSLAAMIAIWKLGAAYVPIDPETPWDRVEYIIKEVDPRCIVSEASLINEVKYKICPILTFTDVNYSFYSKNFNVKQKISTQALAYLIFTSGSTGQPKGVMVSHSNLSNYINWFNNNFSINSADCFSLNSSLAFDFSVTCTFAPLVAGAKIIILSESDVLDLESYAKRLREHRVSFSKWTPSYFKLWIDYVYTYKPDLSYLKYLMLAGEPLLTIYVERWFSFYPQHTLINEYGPTETTVGITTHCITKTTLDVSLTSIPIGKEIANTFFYVVNSENKICNQGEIGELWIGGDSVSHGYFRNDKLTQCSFITSPFSKKRVLLYRTGDWVKQLSDGSYLYIGRVDNQVKLNGYRVELNEVEHFLLKHPLVDHAFVTVAVHGSVNERLVAYLVIKKDNSFHQNIFRDYLLEYLPHYMVPQTYYRVPYFPLNANGKIDKETLDLLSKGEKQEEINSEVKIDFKKSWEGKIIGIIEKYTHQKSISLTDSFFSLGITSLTVPQIIEELNQRYSLSLKPNDLFFYPTVKDFVRYLEEAISHCGKREKSFCLPKKCFRQEPVAIIGMACRLPGAETPDELWELCQKSKSGITHFNANQENFSKKKSHWVYSRGLLKDIGYFDADFFSFTPTEASLTDPQHRLLLESAWEALEKSGYFPSSPGAGRIGICVSMNDSTYLVDQNFLSVKKPHYYDRFSTQRLISSQFAATKLSYYLNCTGPSFTLQTACSSSLVSVILGCQQLVLNQCDMVLAGGVSLITPQETPYYYQPDDIYSPDGHCYPFDKRAHGTVFSNGLGLVVLKRLSDALKDRDTILSVIKGSGLNNDGHNKMSYTAPSGKGQVECILSAFEVAEVSADTVQYVETHGTGTVLGDPIEIRALTEAFHHSGARRQQFCALGSLKSNIGHTHVAAGVAGLIKTVMALYHQQIPPSTNYDTSNPEIDFKHSPFYVNTRLQHWPQSTYPRRAAVSAFGVGGTNAHVILEQTPLQQPEPTRKNYFALIWSAKQPEALIQYYDLWLNFLENKKKLLFNEQSFLADIGYTLQKGRNSFPYRAGVICKNILDLIRKLERLKKISYSSAKVDEQPKIAFYLANRLPQEIKNFFIFLERHNTYRKLLNDLLNQLKTKGYFNKEKNNLHSFLMSLEEEHLTQLSTAENFVLSFLGEYAMTLWLMHHNIFPDVLIAKGTGSYVAACMLGILKLEKIVEILFSCKQELLPFFKTHCAQKISPNAIPCIFKVEGNLTKNDATKWRDVYGNHGKLTTLLTQWIHDNNRLLFFQSGKEEHLETYFRKQSGVSYRNYYFLSTDFLKLKRKIEFNLLNILLHAWRYGVPIEWSKCYGNERRSRIPLPTYPFQRKYYWLDKVSSEKNSTNSPCSTLNKENPKISYYHWQWVRDREKMNYSYSLPSFSEKTKFILFDDQSSLSANTFSLLQSTDLEVVRIQVGNKYQFIKNNHLIINPENEEEYLQFFKSQLSMKYKNIVILHFWSYSVKESFDDNDLLKSKVLFRGFYSGYFIYKSLGKLNFLSSTSLIMISNGINDIFGNERRSPLKNLVLSLSRVLPLETKEFRILTIDSDFPTKLHQITSYSTALINIGLSMTAKNENVLELEDVFSFRKGFCWRKTYSKIKINRSNLNLCNLTLSPGVYLITGGLGGMGLIFAEYLSQQNKVTLILVSRSQFPECSQWDALLNNLTADRRMKAKIILLKKIINNGSKVVIQKANVSSYDAMKDVISIAEASYGKIRGVFHLAGIPGSGLSMLKNLSQVREVFSPKIQGTWVLAQLLKNHILDFVISASSLTSLVGGVGQLDYCAANIFLDTFMASEPFRNCKKNLTINWNAWSSVGMAAHHVDSDAHIKLYEGNCITPTQGVEVLRELFNLNVSQAIVSRYSPSEETRRIRGLFCGQGASFLEKINFVGNRSILEAIWKECLGVSKINKNDTFYSLGGDSLVALQMLSAIESQLKVRLSLQELNHPHTLDSLLNLIEYHPVNSGNSIIPLSEDNFHGDIENANHFQKTIYFFHPVGGSVLCYFPFVSHLDTEYSCYALQDPELSREKKMFNSIGEMAGFYAKKISIHCCGKAKELVFIGYSFGGNLAVEVSKLLSKKTMSVSKIILIDSWCNLPEVKKNFPSDEEPKILKTIAYYYGHGSHRYRGIERRLKWLREYQPSKVEAPVILLKAAQLLSLYKKINKKDNGWRSYCLGSFSNYLIEGNHDTVLEISHIDSLVSLLSKILRN